MWTAVYFIHEMYRHLSLILGGKSVGFTYEMYMLVHVLFVLGNR